MKKSLSKPGVATITKGRATRYASSDESCKRDEITERKGKMEQNQKTMEPSSSYERENRSQITKQKQTLKAKTSKDYRRQTNDAEHNIKGD